MSEEAQLKRLMRKAELCRYAHGRMMEESRCRRRIVEIIIAVLTCILGGLVAVLYRGISSNHNDWVVLAIAVIPPVLLLTQTIGAIFGFGDQETKCAAAVHIWGQWIREADSLKKIIHSLPLSEAKEKNSNLDEKYIACMKETPPIPNRKFLSYKLCFRKYRTLSEQIDSADESQFPRIKKEIENALRNIKGRYK